MCSRFNDDEVEKIVSNGCEATLEQRKACKCGSVEIVLTLTLYGAFCRECFLQRVAHKFRSEFGKSRLVRDNEEVAVAFSGGKKSTVMVNLITEGLSKRAQKKLRFNPTLIHIIEPNQWEGSYIFDSEIVSRMASMDMPFFVFALNQVFDNHLVPIMTDKDNLENKLSEIISTKLDFSRIFELRQSLKQKTSMESIHTLLRKELISRICLERGFSKVLTGDTSTQLAVRLISFVSQGRGGQISYEMEFADARNVDVVFVKPMRAFLDEEIDTLIEQKNLQFAEKPVEKWEIQTINSLTEDFIKKLQTENDKTLSIICRTGEKLMATKEKSDVNGGSIPCCLCKAPLENKPSKMTANYAVKVSASITNKLKANRADNSNGDASILGIGNLSLELKNQNGTVLGNCGTNNINGCCGSNRSDCCSSTSSLLSKDEVMNYLCYGCRILVKDMKDVGNLPSNIVEDVREQIRRKKMLESIEDFILTDSDDDFCNQSDMQNISDINKK